MAKSNPDQIQLTPSILVIFGITGDLSERKLLPALYHLFKDGLLHEHTQIVGITRREVKIDDLLDGAKTCVLDEDGVCDPAAMKKLRGATNLFNMNVTEEADYQKLQTFLDQLEDKQGMCLTRLFYLAIPPQILTPIVKHLGAQGLNKGCGHGKSGARLLLEKPFGFDVKTAEELIDETTSHFKEEQIFRIDHYLAKETVQNILTFRFRNPIFEDIWDAKHIKAIEVVADEKLDIEGRANFYEQTGALRDLIQSHLLHIMAVVMMDKPSELTDASAIHEARLKLLESMQPVRADKLQGRAIRGQYASYKKEVGNQRSHMETFAALEIFSHHPRWKHVPIYVRTGKALSKKQTAVTVHFQPLAADHDHTNVLTFHIQPNESISVQLWVKRPGFKHELQTAPMSFSYKQTFDDEGHPDAYERVLVDAIRGDRTLFATSDEVLAAWRILEPVIQAWSQTARDLKIYRKGATGESLAPFS
jgi:glucose-6-phosphate 1-dehydrogenase